MKVKTLIKKLEDMNPDAIVVVLDRYGDYVKLTEITEQEALGIGDVYSEEELDYAVVLE